MKTKNYFLSLFLIIVSYNLTAQTKTSPIQTFANSPNLKHASIGFCVKDFSGKQLSSYNANKSYTPASVLKIITTATAIEVLGSDFRYETTLAKDKNDQNHILVRGCGDPTLGTEFMDNNPTAFLREWTEQIKQNVDTTKEVRITIIDDYFGYDGISHRWIRQDMGSYYATGTYGISVFDNMYRLYLNTTKRDSCPEIVKTVPEIDINFDNTLTLGRDDAYIFGQPFINNRQLIGSLPAGKTSLMMRGDIPDPGLYLGQRLADELSKNGMIVSGVETTYNKYYEYMHSPAKYSFEEDIFYTHKSPPLKDIISDTNVRSNNHYAEHLIRAIGRAKNKDIYSNPLNEGIAQVNLLWKGRGLDTDALFMYDGSGLAPSNAVSAAFVCDLLMYMQNKSKNAKNFLDSFAKAGKTGTVRNLLKGTRLQGKVYVKSGTIVNVRCYAGYYIEGNKKYTFAILVNNYNGTRNNVVKEVEKLLLNVF